MSDLPDLDEMPLQQLLENAFQAFDEDRLGEAETLYRHSLTRIPVTDGETYRNARHMLAFVMSHQQAFDDARQIYQDLLADAHQRQDLMAISVNLHQLGMVERLASQYEQASRFFEAERQHLLQHLPDFSLGLSANAYERGYLQLLLGHPAVAESILQESLKFAEVANDAICTACALRGLGEVYIIQRDKDRAQACLSRSAALFRQQGDKKAVAEVNAMLQKSSG